MHIYIYIYIYIHIHKHDLLHDSVSVLKWPPLNPRQASLEQNKTPEDRILIFLQHFP